MPCGPVVKVYSIETGRIIRELVSGHEGLITHLELGPSKTNKVGDPVCLNVHLLVGLWFLQ